MGDDDIFDEEGGEISDEEHQKRLDSIKEDDRDLEKQTKHVSQNGSRRKYGILGAVVIGLLVGGSVYGIQAGIIGESEPFDSSTCNFGIHQDFFGERCVTLEEFEAMKQEEEKPTPVQEKPDTGSGGTKDVSSTSDKVELEITNDMIGHYVVTSDDDWYGDFVDIRKIPSKIEDRGNMKINFRCYTDDFAGTSTYFATFRNNIENNLTVEVYIGGIEVETKSTNTNKALILEGSCYGHDS